MLENERTEKICAFFMQMIELLLAKKFVEEV